MTSHAFLSEPSPPNQRTPLPAGQLSILMFLRFTEASSTLVIFPFLNEVRTCCKMEHTQWAQTIFLPSY